MTPSVLWNRLRSTYWFVPSLITLGAIGMALALVRVDRWADDGASWLALVYGGGPDGARALLSAVAGSIVTVVSVTFSVTIVALTVSSQHFGPRILVNFMRDVAAQTVLGILIGTFAYCLLVLRTVQGRGEGYDLFVPQLAVTVAVLMALLSVAALIFYVHHVSVSMSIASITAVAAHNLDEAIDRMYPQQAGEPLPVASSAVPAPPADARPIAADAGGYVESLDLEAIIAAARRAEATVWMSTAPGAFVIVGDTLAHAAPSAPSSLVAAVRDACVLGHERTTFQDVEYATHQLLEVALRALSPGVNEPFTALACIDRLAQGLARFVGRPLPSAARVDADGRVRLVAYPLTCADVLRGVVESILAVSDAAMVHARLMAMLDSLAARAERESDRREVRVQAAAVLAAAMQAGHPASRRLAVRHTYRSVMAHLRQ
ncbi:DUF2254 domain-containing protein [Luteitalea sp.]|uniref:DUF2254 domain-containing protein n=1 Tax=Luteitalea sp. TaxID=2004800 RepID=UPI0025BD32BC|nr:DUF2254 domain-containing protein [Luteitalea sp.]